MPTLILTAGRTPNLQTVTTDWEALPVMLTYAEAAQVMRCGVGAIRAAIETGQLQPTKTGRRIVRISRYRLQAWAEGREIEPITMPYRDIA